MDINTILQTLIAIMIGLSNLVKVMAQQFSSTSFIEVYKCSYNYDYKWDIKCFEKQFAKLGQKLAECFMKLHLIATFKSFTSYEGRWIEKIEGFKESLWSLIKWCAKYYRFHNFGYSTKSNKFTGVHPEFIDTVQSKIFNDDNHQGDVYNNVDPWIVHALELIPAELVNTKLYVPTWEYIINGKKFYTFLKKERAWDIEFRQMEKRYNYL